MCDIAAVRPGPGRGPDAVPSDRAALDRLLRLRSAWLRPRYLTQSAWVEHLPFAFWVMEAHRPACLVELGLHYGVSYFAFCQAAAHLALGTNLYGIDTWDGDSQAGFYGPEVFRAASRHNQHYSAFSQLIRSDFDTALLGFPDGSVDLLHIDGLHSKEAVMHDFTSWLPKLSPRALVLLHDTNMRDPAFGVWSFLHDLRKDYPVFEFRHGHGLGVIGVGQEQTPLLRTLFAAEDQPAAKEEITSCFAQLGHGCLNAQRKGQLDNLLREERVASAALRRKITILEEELGPLRDIAASQSAAPPDTAGPNTLPADAPPELPGKESADPLQGEIDALLQQKRAWQASESSLLTQLDQQAARLVQLEGSLKDRFREIALLSARLMAQGDA